MKVVDYLKETYGYSVPIFLKDIRIGRKSKTAIRKELSRAVKEGQIVRKAKGVYCFKRDDQYIDSVTFEAIVERKFIRDDFGFPGFDLNTYGYYTGQTFLNQIGLSQQVPAVLEIVTNKTSCKRYYNYRPSLRALLTKPKTKIDSSNFIVLQFLDAFKLLDADEIKENHDRLFKYISKYITKSDFEKYIGLYSTRTKKLIVEGGLINAFR